ncbi:hypothetical protein PLESTB_001694800 [Pleodorina starrii]|uniref:Uncharacterized protein n=1 Tax=Pleodorina starrii TaxID=330485 RepID=A0A9W6BYG6_9CHLO|nr:hypothetical protein PLESTB_001685000 [Pleodorina starrii]GLC60881.1 hypothetical protein PLESTB_001686800 [Pleodorina starrii]GLC60938.1 hypothetical protein PLESTB_001694800 [Pleodorina starrii]
MKAVKPQTNPTMHQIAPQQCNYSNQSQHTAVLAPPATGPSGFWEPGTLLRPLHTTPGPQGAGGCVLGLGRQHGGGPVPSPTVPGRCSLAPTRRRRHTPALFLLLLLRLLPRPPPPVRPHAFRDVPLDGPGHRATAPRQPPPPRLPAWCPAPTAAAHDTLAWWVSYRRDQPPPRVWPGSLAAAVTAAGS